MPFALFIKGDVDGVGTRDSFELVPTKFGGPFQVVGLQDVGHFSLREAPVADLLLAFLAGERPRTRSNS